jgi:hypothetical protein
VDSVEAEMRAKQRQLDDVLARSSELVTGLQRRTYMPLSLANVNQANVENEVSQQYRAAGGSAGARVVQIQGWDPQNHTDPNSDFMRAFGGGRRPRTDEVIAVVTERVPNVPGRVEVYLVPNTLNDTIRNLHDTMKVKVGEVQL